MHAIKNIVVGVDYSEHAKTALRQAARLAKAHGATVHAIHVVESFAMADMSEAMSKTLEQISAHFVGVATKYVTRTAGEAGFAPGEVKIKVEVGMPVPAIARLAASVHADLLIVGRIGSTTEAKGAGGLAVQCVRAIPTRVLVLKQDASGPFRRIVAATDFSEFARLAVAEAARFAKADGAELHVVHVRRPEIAAPLGDPLLTPPVWLGDQAELDAAADRLARRKVEAEVVPHDAMVRGLKVMCAVHTHANAGLGLLEYAEGVKADLLVMGTLGRTGLKKLLLGSTAERVLRTGACSMLAIKAVGYPGEVV